MKELNLVYERGSEPNTIDVCTNEKLFLGKIFSQGVFGIGFQQATKLNEADKQEIGFVMQSIQNVL
jgi:hypothetical protein